MKNFIHWYFIFHIIGMLVIHIIFCKVLRVIKNVHVPWFLMGMDGIGKTKKGFYVWLYILHQYPEYNLGICNSIKYHMCNVNYQQSIFACSTITQQYKKVGLWLQPWTTGKGKIQRDYKIYGCKMALD